MSTPDEVASFSRRSRAVARDFLHTVVVVDDQAFYPASVPAPEGLELIIEPDPSIGVDLEEDVPSGPQFTPRGAPTSDGDKEPIDLVQVDGPTHNLDAKALIDAFAEEHIVCSILRPIRRDEPLEARTLALAQRADLVVLDWVLNKDDGIQTLNLIQRMLTEDRGRLRLIAIYTAEQNLAGILDRLAVVKVADESLSWERRDNFTVEWGATRLVVFAKQPEAGTMGKSDSPAQLQGREVGVAALPTRLIEEFAEMIGGLVPNLALRALATLRASTYPILQNLHKGLDAPYITHRTLLPHPEDAADHLVTLVVGAVHALLEQREVAAEAGGEAVASWLNEASRSRSTPFKLPQLTEDQIRAFMAGRALEDLSQGRGDTLAKSLTGEILGGKAQAKPVQADQEYAMKMMIRPWDVADGHPPVLHLGMIVQRLSPPEEQQIPATEDVSLDDRLGEKEDPSYLLCMQPLCDSARLKAATAFPFLPFHKVEPTEKTSVIVPNGMGIFAHLSLKPTPSRCEMVVFEPNPDKRVVRAEKDGEGFVFRSRSGVSFRWVAELKPEQAQRWANDYAATLSRVGVDESEWLRRLGKK